MERGRSVGEEKEVNPESGGDLDGLDEAFDEALALLSDANAKVTEVLETMDNPEAISIGAEVDEDGNIHDGSEEAEEEVGAETEVAEAEPTES